MNVYTRYIHTTTGIIKLFFTTIFEKVWLKKEIGHYTAICLCSGNFIEYNDLVMSEKN